MCKTLELSECLKNPWMQFLPVQSCPAPAPSGRLGHCEPRPPGWLQSGHPLSRRDPWAWAPSGSEPASSPWPGLAGSSKSGRGRRPVQRSLHRRRASLSELWGRPRAGHDPCLLRRWTERRWRRGGGSAKVQHKAGFLQFQSQSVSTKSTFFNT